MMEGIKMRFRILVLAGLVLLFLNIFQVCIEICYSYAVVFLTFFSHHVSAQWGDNVELFNSSYPFVGLKLGAKQRMFKKPTSDWFLFIR